MRLNVLFRKYNPAAGDASGPFFAESKFTVEAGIRRCLNVAAQISVQTLAKKYNDRLKDLFRKKIEEREKSNSKDFIALFEAMYESGEEVGGGFTLLEPFANRPMDPPLRIEGCTFANQGSHAQKRLRIMAESDDGHLVPIQLLVGPRRALGAQGIAPMANPWTDIRLLAGTVAVGSPKLYYLLLQFINQILPDVKIMSLRDPNVSDLFMTDTGAGGITPLVHAYANAANPTSVKPGSGTYIGTNGGNTQNAAAAAPNDVRDTVVNENGIVAVFPTIFSYHDIETIRGMIQQGMADYDGNPMAFLPFYGDRIIRFIRDKIRERLNDVTDDKEIDPLVALFEFDQRVVGEIGSGNRQGDNPNNYQHHGFYMAHRRWTYIPGSPALNPAAVVQAGAEDATTHNRWPGYPVAGRTVLRGGYSEEEVHIHRQKYDEMRRELQKLKRDPVLWINGPRLDPRQGVEVLGGNVQPAWIGWQTAPPEIRPTILPGFDPQSLKSYCHDAIDGVSGAYHLTKLPGGAPGQLATHYFSTDSTINSRIMDASGAPAPALGPNGRYDDADCVGVPDQHRRRDPDGSPRRGTRAFYSNYADPMSNLINSLNPVYNIVSTPGVATRLSDWKEALGIKDEIDAVPDEARDSDEPAVRLAEPPYHSLIEIPDNETRFRLGLMDPPRAADASVAAEEMDFDAEFKQFEYDMHVGDTDAYTQEILTVIRLALESILIPTTDVGIDDKDTDLLAMYTDTSDLYNRVIPVMTPPSTAIDPLDIQGTDRITGGWSTGFKNHLVIRQNRRANFGRIPRVFRLEADKYIMSACSQFVYRHVVTHATAPFARESGRHPNYREVAAMLSSLNPFPLREGYARTFIQEALKLCKDRVRAAFSEGYHLVQHMEHSRPAEIHQPYAPLLVTFTKTGSNDGRLRWSVGSESTWMLEGIVLALHLINAIAKDAGPSVPVPAERVDLDLVPPMVLDINQPATAAKYEALRRMAVEPQNSRVQTHSFTSLKRDMVYNADRYAAWLGVVDGRRLNQAGRYHMGSDKRGDKPVGNFSSSGERTIPFNSVRFEDIRATRTAQNNPNIWRNDIQLAIDAATNHHVYEKIIPTGAITEDAWYDAIWREIYTGIYIVGLTKLWNNGDDNSRDLRQEIRLLATVGVILAAHQWYRREYNSNGTHGRAGNNIGGGNNRTALDVVLERVTRAVATGGAGAWVILQNRMYNRGANLTPESDGDGVVPYLTILERKTNEVSAEMFGNDGTIPDEESFVRLVSRMIRFTAGLFELKPSMASFQVPVQGLRYHGLDPSFPAMGVFSNDDNTTYRLARNQPEYDADYDPVNYDDAFSQQLSGMHTGNEGNQVYEFYANGNGYLNAGSHHYYEGQHISIPLWEAENDYTPTTRRVGYVIFERLKITVNKVGDANSPRVATFDWYGSKIQDVAVYDSTQMIRLGENGGRAMYGFNTNVVCGLLINPRDVTAGVRPLLRMTRFYPFWSLNLDDDEILRETAATKLDKAEEKLPYEFSVVQVPRPKDEGHGRDDYDRPHTGDHYDAPLTVADVVDRLMGSFNGLHFSNSHSLHSTVMAMATGENRAKIHEFLNRETKVYKRPIPWTTSVEHGNPAYRGDAILLEMLYADFEASSSRATDTPMANRVLVRCKGPGPADKATPCYVDTYFYRTDTFYRIEVKAMEVFKDIVIKTSKPPGGSVANPIGRHFHRIGNLHDLLQLRPEAASAVAKFMINLYKFEKIAHRSNQPRDKAAVNIQSRTITIDANHILYRI